MTGLPPSRAGSRGAVLPALAWSVAVVLAGGILAVFTTAPARGQTASSHGAELSAPVVGTDLGSPGAATAGGAAGHPALDGPGVSTGSGAPVPGSAAAAAPSTTAQASPGARSTTTVGRTAVPAAAAAAASRMQPDAGTYPLRITGTSSVDGKAAAVPGTGSLIVQAQGGDQQQRTAGVPGDLVLVERASAAGIDLVSFSLAAGSKTVAFRPPSPVAFVRTEPGASWSWSVRSTDGTVGLSQTATVSTGGSVSVGGASMPTVTVQRVFTVSGAASGTVRLTSSVSLADRLPLVQHQSIDVKATLLGLVTTHVVSDATATLTSTTPR